jgi:hypothetical protein
VIEFAGTGFASDFFGFAFLLAISQTIGYALAQISVFAGVAGIGRSF